MNIIFLDIDGVLNSNIEKSPYNKELSSGKIIDNDKVKLLSQLVNQTSSKIVLHSGWKYWFDKNISPLNPEAQHLIDLLDENGLAIYDITPDLATDEIKRSKKFSLVKASEILQWIDTHSVENWIVLDDLDLHNSIVSEHQIKTDSQTGLTKSDIEAAKMQMR